MSRTQFISSIGDTMDTVIYNDHFMRDILYQMLKISVSQHTRMNSNLPAGSGQAQAGQFDNLLQRTRSRLERAKEEAKEIMAERKEAIQSWTGRPFPGDIIEDDRQTAHDYSQKAFKSQEDHPWTLSMWCDGSYKMEKDLWGAAVVYKSGPLSLTERGYTSAGEGLAEQGHAAEIIAIANAVSIALNVVVDSTGKKEACKKVQIFSDSSGALRRIQKGPSWGGPKKRQVEFLISQIYTNADALDDLSARLELRWEPGHVGALGNTIADRIAVAAATTGKNSSSTRVICPDTFATGDADATGTGSSGGGQSADRPLFSFR